MHRTMTDTGVDGLNLRESYDHTARPEELVHELNTLFKGKQHVRILDPACGTGSNFRYLAPRLNYHQSWFLNDIPSDNFEALKQNTGQWAQNLGYHFESANTQNFRLDTGQFQISCNLQQGTPATIPSSEFANRDLVTGAVFLDRVSENRLHWLFEVMSTHHLPFLFALHYNGMIIWRSANPLDARITTAFNSRLRTTENNELVLGDRAPSAAGRIAEQYDYEITRAESNWHLEERDIEMILRYIDYMEELARPVIEEDSLDLLENWSSRKKYEARGGLCRLMVGHTDILGVPVRS